MVLAVVLSSLAAHFGRAAAVTSSASVASSLRGNGHNISFDGRLFLVRDGTGWVIRLLRPEATTYLPSGLPDAEGPMWSPKVNILSTPNPADLLENAVAICEEDSTQTPFACNAAGDPMTGGAFECYQVWLLDSDAVTPEEAGGFVLRRRQLKVWVENPGTPTASIFKHELSSTLQPLTPMLKGIEPTVTADGKLLIWQGHPDNDGKIDILMYAVNDNACAASGWSQGKSISSMATDPSVLGTYRLAERALRSADGDVFAPGDLVRGAYPWLMPEGDAIVFQASNMPCQSENVPAGCGPRRNSFAALGYSTNWGVAIVDGEANPAADDVVRLFFSSPGPAAFAQLPVSDGIDVWPFFGTNTQNYVELIFDDGLDGNYAGFWHFNESVDKEGDLDLSHIPDVSGYFNTGALLGGALVSKVNNGVLGRALAFDGVDDRAVVPHSITLNPVNGATLDFWIRPTQELDCDGNNNYRLLLSKGSFDSSPYSVVVEESRALQVRFNVNGSQESLITPVLPLNAWTHVSCEYDGPTGQAGCWFDDVEVIAAQFDSGTLAGNSNDLFIGAPGARAACPNGDGAFVGMLDELSISRYARRLGEAPVSPGDPDAGPGGPGAGADAGSGAGSLDGGSGEEGAGDEAGNASDSGCGCTSGSGRGPVASALWLLIALAVVRRVAGRRSRRAETL